MARDAFRLSKTDGRRFNQTGMIELIPTENGYAIQGGLVSPLATVPTIKAANEWLNGPEYRAW